MEASDSGFVSKRPFVLCPTRRTHLPPGCARWRWSRRWGEPIEMDAHRHDRTVAAISHLPYLLSAALVATVAQGGRGRPTVWQLAAGGFRDTSRLAAQDLGMMGDILSTNTQAVATLLARFRAQLALLEAALIEEDQKSPNSCDRCAKRESIGHANTRMETLNAATDCFVVQTGECVSAAKRASPAISRSRTARSCSARWRMAQPACAIGCRRAIPKPRSARFRRSVYRWNGSAKPNWSFTAGSCVNAGCAAESGQCRDGHSSVGGDHVWAAVPQHPRRQRAAPPPPDEPHRHAADDDGRGYSRCRRQSAAAHQPAKLRGIHYQLPVASAQVKSAIAVGGVVRRGRDDVVEPGPARDHTERMLSAMGADIARRWRCGDAQAGQGAATDGFHCAGGYLPPPRS